MSLLYLLLPSLSSMTAVSKCLLQARWEEHEGSWPTASAPQSRFWLPLCCVLCSYFLLAFQAPICRLSPPVHSHWPFELQNLSYSALCKCIHLRPQCIPVTLFTQVLMLGKGSVFSSSILWSQHLSGPLGPLLLMTCQESFKGTQGWNYGVIGINMQAAISGPLCCVIAKETSNHEWEGFPGDQRVTYQWISFFVGQTGGICNKGLFHWSPKPALLRLTMAE